MKPLLLTLLLTVSMAALTLCQSQIRKSDASSKTILLFDGKTLDGWIQYPADTWTIKDGAMASTGGPRGFIYTKDDYENFRLTFKMRHLPAPADSGKKGGDHQACVLIFCTSPPAPDQRGLDAMGGIQFQPPNGYNWDYRPGHNPDNNSRLVSVYKDAQNIINSAGGIHGMPAQTGDDNIELITTDVQRS